MLRVQRVHQNASLPRRAHDGDAGYDISSVESVLIPPNSTGIVSTGLTIVVPEGTYGRLAPRSGLAAKHSISVGAGVVDRGYRGELKVLLFNHDKDKAFIVSPGDRIAQLILECIRTPEVVECQDLEQTERGAGGFGSSGLQ